MGKITLTALNVRKSAMARIRAKTPFDKPAWLDVVADIPPAQVLTRKQPIQHHLTQTRTRSLRNGRTEQYSQIAVQKKSKSATTNRHLFSPMKLRYEEDVLRKQFFSDHPWELARPRVVVETDGNQHKNADWSKGLIQPGIPLSGESVVQRQLWLLENLPDITLAQSYDVARKEFYTLRRQQETRDRIAAEEARHMGARFGMSYNQVSMKIEGEVYDNWEVWAREQNMLQLSRNAAFAGTEGTGSETEALQENVEAEEGSTETTDSRRGRNGALGKDVFAMEGQNSDRRQNSKSPGRSL